VPDEQALDFARELARADEDAAATLAELVELAAEVEALRVRAAGLADRVARLPGEQEAARTAVEDAEREVARRRETAAAAEAVSRAADDDRARAAANALTRAADGLRMAERRLVAARADDDRLRAEELAAAGEAAALTERARAVAAGLHERSALAAAASGPPEDDLASVAAWATNARAALFVARGQLASQRDQLLRQANELAAAVLGEPVPASSAAAVVRRVEAASE
jgi:chromosome segregation ATPase